MVKFPNIGGALTLDSSTDPADSFRAGLRINGTIVLAEASAGQAVCNGNMYGSEGRLAVIFEASVATPIFYNAGLPYDANGRMVVTSSVIAYYVNGAPMSDGGYVCIS